MAMDKSITKMIMDQVGIPNAPWRNIPHYTEADIPRLTEELEVPCAVKVVNGGSSLGLALPDTKEELAQALHDLLRYGSHILVEKKIHGRELTVAVLGDRWLPAAETIPASGAFDYAAKYQPMAAGGAREICPAEITPEQMAAAGELALRLHRALGLQVYSRTDMILDGEGNLWCLEINSLPGMTPASFVPKEAAAVGMSYNQLCEEIVRLSYEIQRKG